MNHIKTIETFMSTFYPELTFDVRCYDEKYYVIITNKLINRNFTNQVQMMYEYHPVSHHLFLENDKEFKLSSVYSLLDSFIPTISDNIYFSYINPLTSSLESIPKPITLKSSSTYTTTHTTSPNYSFCGTTMTIN